MTIDNRELESLRKGIERPSLIDVREPDEFATGAISGACNVPLGRLSAALSGFVPGEHLVFVCRSGQRSLKAATFARSVGFVRAQSLEGGMEEWNNHG